MESVEGKVNKISAVCLSLCAAFSVTLFCLAMKMEGMSEEGTLLTSMAVDILMSESRCMKATSLGRNRKRRWRLRHEPKVLPTPPPKSRKPGCHSAFPRAQKRIRLCLGKIHSPQMDLPSF